MTSASAKDEGRLTLKNNYSSQGDRSIGKMTAEEIEQRGQQKSGPSVGSYSQQRPKLFADTNITPETPLSPTYKRQFYAMEAQPDTPLGEQKPVSQKNTRRSYTPNGSAPTLYRSAPLQKNPFADWPIAEADEGYVSNQALVESLELPIEEVSTPDMLPNHHSVRADNNDVTSNAARVENTEMNMIKTQLKEEQKNFRRRIVKHMIDKRNMEADHLQREQSWENTSRLEAQAVDEDTASKWFPIHESVRKPKRIDERTPDSESDPPLYDNIPATIRQLTVDVWLLRADVAHKMKEWRAMELYSATAYELADGLGWQPFKARCKMSLGKALYHMENWDAAAEAFEAAKATEGYYVSESEITHWLEKTRMRLQKEPNVPIHG